MSTKLVALTAASVLLASTLAVAAPPEQTGDDQGQIQGQAQVYVPNPEDYHRFDHQN
jgi:hypothetical protein